MKVLTLFIILFLGTIHTFGQTRTEVKIYQNTDFFHTGYTDPVSQQTVSSNQTNFSRISIAATFHTGKKYLHELELFIPQIESKSDPSYPMNYEPHDPPSSTMVRTFTSYSFRYEFSKEMKQSDKLIFTLGAGINPYYTKTSYLTQVSNSYNRYLWESGVALNFVSRIAYRITSRLGLELSIPFKVYDARYIQRKIENPSIPVRQQTSGSWNHIFFESAYTLRFGISFML